MNWHALVANVATTVVFVTFLAIVWWAWSGRQKDRFDRAAMEPFALPDEFEKSTEKNAGRSGNE